MKKRKTETVPLGADTTSAMIKSDVSWKDYVPFKKRRPPREPTVFSIARMGRGKNRPQKVTLPKFRFGDE